MSTVLWVIAILAVFIPLLSIVIFVHEMGHFLVARALGVGVDVFALGFGKKLVGKKRGRTDFRIQAIPFGGYVKMVGEEPDKPLAEKDIPISFSHKPVWARAAIVAAGPLTNLVFGLLVFWVVFFFRGEQIHLPVVEDVADDSPAQAAGILPGDEILSINGKKVRAWGDLGALINETQGGPLLVRVLRGGEEPSMEVIPKLSRKETMLGESVNAYIIGIGSGNHFRYDNVGFFKAGKMAGEITVLICTSTVEVLVKIFQRKISARKTVGGPIMMASMTRSFMEEGFLSVLGYLAILSVAIGFINFFPIPILDGGHLVFYGLEAIMRRPLSEKVRENAMKVGLAMLLTLMVLVTVNDILRMAGI